MRKISMGRAGRGMLKYLAIVSLIAVLSVPFAAHRANAAGIGIGPSELKITNAVRGATYQDTVFVRYVGDESQRMQLSTSGDISDWVKFYESTNPAAAIREVTARPTDWTYLTVKFTIPADTKLSIATGNLWVSVTTPATNVGGMAVGLQVKVDVTIEIAGIARIMTGKVTEMSVGDTVVGQPVNIVVGVANTGNASVNPKIGVKIISGSQPIAEFAKSDVTVDVGKQQVINISWETGGQREGNYSAEVQVSLEDKVLDTKKIAFRLLPAGSGQTSVAGTGQLTSLSLEGKATLGTNKIQAIVNNNGASDFKAKFIGEVHYDGKLIDTIQSDEVMIAAGKTDKLNMYLKVASQGKYEIKGYVNYGGNKSGPKEFVFSVGSGAETSQTTQPNNVGLYIIIAAVGVMGIGGVIMLVQRRRRQVSHDQ